MPQIPACVSQLFPRPRRHSKPWNAAKLLILPKTGQIINSTNNFDIPSEQERALPCTIWRHGSARFRILAINFLFNIFRVSVEYTDFFFFLTSPTCPSRFCFSEPLHTLLLLPSYAYNLESYLLKHMKIPNNICVVLVKMLS